eukprot:jgi/Psemu1/16321/gm1.16321_g
MTTPQDDPEGFDNSTAPQVNSSCPSLVSSSVSSYESFQIGAVNLLPRDSLQPSIPIDVYCDIASSPEVTAPVLKSHLETNGDPNFDRDNPIPDDTNHAPREPQELDSTIELTSDAYKLWKWSRALHVEWNKYDREALLITDKKFPTMLGDLKDLDLDAFPRGTTVLTAFQVMEEDLCTTAAQHQLTRELTKKMNALTYTPSPIGPKEYFLDKDWMKYRETEGKSGFAHYEKFWGRHLKELYSSYHNTTNTANLADSQAAQRFTEPENKQRELAHVCQEIYSQVTETATAASTMTMSNQWETAMAVLQADVNQLKSADASRANGSATRRPTLHEWKQYKYYCHSCGVNLTHDGRSCYNRRNKVNHQEGATYDNQMGGATRNTDRWLNILRVPSRDILPQPTQRTVTFAPDVAFHISAPPGFGALDSAATDHFMLSTATDLLDLPRLPLEARGCHKFDEVELPLVSVPKLCSTGCHVEFSKDDVTVIGPTQHVILTGQRDPLRNLYMVPLHQSDKRETAKNTANLADIQAAQRFTEPENKQRELAHVCQEIYSQVTETATAASTMTMSNQWETAMAVLQADVNRLKSADASRTNVSATRQPALHVWKQYKYYCHSCGVNLTHNGRSCYNRRNKVNHQEGATYDNQMGGTTRNTDRWLNILRDPSRDILPQPTQRTVTFAPDVAFHINTPGALTVGCANGSKMLSTATDLLDLPRLPLEARGCQKFNEVELPLVSVPKLCSTGCHVEFSKDDVTVIGPTQQVILTGQPRPFKGDG